MHTHILHICTYTAFLFSTAPKIPFPDTRERPRLLPSRLSVAGQDNEAEPSENAAAAVNLLKEELCWDCMTVPTGGQRDILGSLYEGEVYIRCPWFWKLTYWILMKGLVFITVVLTMAYIGCSCSGL